MKNLILPILFIASFNAFSQSLMVEAHETNVDSTNSTSFLGDLGTEITVRNISNTTIDVKVSREVISATPGTENYFCWTQCYLPQTDVSPHTKSFTAGFVDENSFQVHFDNKDINPASASIKYCAFNASNESDSACTIVHYSVPGTSSIALKTEASFSNFHPNPVASKTKLNYQLSTGHSAKVVVTDMLGKTVQHKVVNNKEGTLIFDVSGTPNGLYFANIYVNNALKDIKRLVVNK